MRLLKQSIILSIGIIVPFMTSCSKRGDVTPVEQVVDSLIDLSLHLHKAECVEVMLVDSEGVVLANRQACWRKGKGKNGSIKTAKDELAHPGQLLFPVFAMACINHRGVNPDTIVAVGAKRFGDIDVVDCQVKLDNHGMVVGALPLYSALHSSVAIVDLCGYCFPTIEELKAAIMLYLPESKIKEKEYLRLCLGEGNIKVSKKEILDFVRNYYAVLQFNDGMSPLCFTSVLRDQKSNSVQESCLLCTDKYTCLVLLKNTCIPGAHQLANEIVEIQCN